MHTSIESYYPSIAGPFRSAVSLHSHTFHSREVLNFLPGIVEKVPLVSALVRQKAASFERENGAPLDFSRGYWCPPLGPRAVFESERQQADARFGLPSFVSITDHDSIDAGLGLAALDIWDHAPVSFEWTVPYEDTVFHIGLHNLPGDQARAMHHACAEFTKDPSPGRLADLLAWMAADPATLIVLNHPLWNAHGNLDQGHQALALLVERCRPFLHATEVNGYRSWTENKAVVRLARSWEMPVVGGGDRHGRAPNAFINLTEAGSFAEFAEEIRVGLRSTVVIMPEYHEHAITRILEATADILRDDDGLEPDQRRWTDRVFVVLDSGAAMPISTFWTRGGPWWVRASIGTMRLLGGPATRPARRLAFSPQEVTL
ncbi:MAG: hypothetical protein AB1806_00920 [Acidobacteriota bacterium]